MNEFAVGMLYLILSLYYLAEMSVKDYYKFFTDYYRETFDRSDVSCLVASLLALPGQAFLWFPQISQSLPVCQ